MNTPKRHPDVRTPEELEIIRKEMLDRKQYLWNRMLQDLEREAIDEHRELADLLRENGDRALEDFREGNALQFVQFKMQELEQIEEALKRMDIGKYGRCVDCGRMINPARLAVRPFAIRCIECKVKKERIDNV